MSSRVLDAESRFGTPSHVRVDYGESICQEGLRHAAHCMLYCIQEAEMASLSEPGKKIGVKQCSVLMQVRSDGTFGFPGGHIKPHEAHSEDGIIEGLNRELKEEMNFEPSEDQLPSGHAHYVSSHLNTSKLLVCHFYATQLTRAQFEELYDMQSFAEDFPEETLGLFSVPVCSTITGSGKSFCAAQNDKFWKSFVTFPFCGNARDQLMIGLESQGITDASFNERVEEFIRQSSGAHEVHQLDD